MFYRRKLVFTKDKNLLVYLTRRANYTYRCHNIIIYHHCDNITLYYNNIVIFLIIYLNIFMNSNVNYYTQNIIVIHIVIII